MRTAVITGASSGIEEACGRTLASRGWRVFPIARRGDRPERIAGETGGQAIVLDLIQVPEEDFAEVANCDLLVNCASGALDLDAIGTATAEDLTNMFNNNVLGTLRITQLLLPRLMASQGCILNTTSTAAIAGYEGGGGYCAGKGAQRVLTQSLRLEMTGVPVRITEVLPGIVHTLEFSFNRFRDDAERGNAIYEHVDRPLSAEDVAHVVALIAELPAHISVDEIVVRPVAQRPQHAQHAFFRYSLGWLKLRPGAYSPVNEGAR